MKKAGHRTPSLIACLAFGLLLVEPSGAAEVAAAPVFGPSSAEAAVPLRLAAADEDAEAGTLQPRYEPREAEPASWYNASYLFGMTRGVAGSTMHPAAKVPLFVLTVPLDIALLPFAAIGGLFG